MKVLFEVQELSRAFKQGIVSYKVSLLFFNINCIALEKDGENVPFFFFWKGKYIRSVSLGTTFEM